MPGVGQGALYKYHIVSRHDGYRVDKADPFALLRRDAAAHRRRSSGTSTTSGATPTGWRSARRAQRARRADVDLRGAPRLVAARARARATARSTYRELGARSSPTTSRDMGFTHVELLPVMEHPFYGSWGYQVTGYFAPTSRYGTPQDFMYLVDHLHQRGIGVILDWVPSHFPTDEHGLGYFDGTHLYEHADPRQGFHPDWGSAHLQLRPQRGAQLPDLAARSSGSTSYHIDGLRVDAVASMLYLDYSRKAGEWIPNQLRRPREPRGRSRSCGSSTRPSTASYPDVQTIAEESTAWPMVSRPTYVGGLGFGLKWDMGWMHDTLRLHRSTTRSTASTTTTSSRSACSTPSPRTSCCRCRTTRSCTARARCSARCPATTGRSSRTCGCCSATCGRSPGKKLLFMGGEFGQWREWNHDEQPRLAPAATTRCTPACSAGCATSTALYRDEPALHELDFEPGRLRVDRLRRRRARACSRFLRTGDRAGDAGARGLQLHAGAARQLPRRRAARRPLARAPQQRRADLRRQRPGQPRRRGGPRQRRARPPPFARACACRRWRLWC